MPDDYLVLWLEYIEMTCRYQSVTAVFQQGKYQIIFDYTPSDIHLSKTSLLAFVSFPLNTCPRNSF